MLWILSILSVAYFCLALPQFMAANPVFYLIGFAVILVNIMVLIVLVKNKNSVLLQNRLRKVMRLAKIASTIFIAITSFFGSFYLVLLFLAQPLAPSSSHSPGEQLLSFCLMVLQLQLLTAAYPIATLFAYRKAGFPLTSSELKIHIVLQLLCFADFADTITLFNQLQEWEEQQTGN